MSRAIIHPRTGPTEKRSVWPVAAGLSSVLAALAASICCIGPLVFALLGIGGAGLLLKLTPYRPYFVAVTALLLGTGFYFAYRRPRRAAAGTAEGEPSVVGPACACPAPRAHRAGKITLWVSTVLVLGFLAFPYLAAWIFGKG